MTGVLLTPPDKHWVCPNCTVTDVTPWDTPNRFHSCAGLAGLTAPLVLDDSPRCSVRAVVREDYIGRDLVQRDGEGRPVMAVVTERWDGSNDAVVFPGTAVMKIEV